LRIVTGRHGQGGSQIDRDGVQFVIRRDDRRKRDRLGLLLLLGRTVGTNAARGCRSSWYAGGRFGNQLFTAGGSASFPRRRFGGCGTRAWRVPGRPLRRRKRDARHPGVGTTAHKRAQRNQHRPQSDAGAGRQWYYTKRIHANPTLICLKIGIGYWVA
jgi:hypothetical protein